MHPILSVVVLLLAAQSGTTLCGGACCCCRDFLFASQKDAGEEGCANQFFGFGVAKVHNAILVSRSKKPEQCFANFFEISGAVKARPGVKLIVTPCSLYGRAIKAQLTA